METNERRDVSGLSKNNCIRKLLRISWTGLVTKKQIYELAKMESELLSHVKSCKLQYFRHVMRLPYDSIERGVMVGPVEGTRARGRTTSQCVQVCQELVHYKQRKTEGTGLC